jgi:hypothetical protein
MHYIPNIVAFAIGMDNIFVILAKSVLREIFLNAIYAEDYLLNI